MRVFKLWIYETPERLVPAFLIPEEWLSGWAEYGFDHVYRFEVPQQPPISYEMGTQAVMRTMPVATVKTEKAYRYGVPVPHVVLLGGGRWLVGHPEVKELSHAAHAPV